MLANAELRELYYEQVLAPTFKIAEHYFLAQSQHGQLRNIDVPLTVRAIAGSAHYPAVRWLTSLRGDFQ